MSQAIITIGTDPEFVLLQDGKAVSAIPVLKRGKDNKIPLGESAIYFDNTLAEMNFQPATSPEEFCQNLKAGFASFKEQFPGFSLGAKASHFFEEKECRHKKAKEFGCDPEFDVYAECTVLPPDSNEAKTFRSAGGHIHIGVSGSNFLQELNNQVLTIKLMDIVVGTALVLMDNDPTSHDRQKLYGKAGRFRFTPYGVEYRTPSNSWTSRPELAETIAQLTFAVARIVEEERAPLIVESFDRETVVNCINSRNKDIANDLWGKIELPIELKERVIELSKVEHSMDILAAWL